MKLATPGLALAAGLLAPLVASAQPLPLGAPFRVNATAAGNQNSPDVAADGADNFRFVWQATAGEPVHQDVRTRRLQANGSLGTDALLSETTTRDQRSPQVDMTDSGDWAAIWTSDQETEGIDRPFGRFTTSAGTVLGAEFEYNADASTDAAVPSIATSGDDYFVGVWRNDSGGDAVRGNFRDRAGLNWGISAVGPADSSTWTGAAGLAGEAWVAAWHAPDVDQSGAWVRCHDFDDPSEPASLVAVDPTGDQEYPDVASDGAFRFVVVWQEAFTLFARIYALAGNGLCDPVTGEIPVSSPGQSALYPRVDMATDGAFVVTWYENTLDADNGVAAREFTKDGSPVGAPFAVHPATLGAQAIPSVAVSATTFAITWTTPDSGIGGDRDIQARSFRRRVVFTDGFESNDVTAWSTSQL